MRVPFWCNLLPIHGLYYVSVLQKEKKPHIFKQALTLIFLKYALMIPNYFWGGMHMECIIPSP